MVNSKQRDYTGKFVGKENTYIKSYFNNTCDIYLGGKYITTIDVDDYVKVYGFHWYKAKNGYIYDSKSMLTIHRFIMNANNDEVIDHINRNKSDNRKCNLRKCNKSENAYNSKIRNNNTTKTTGVWFRKDTNKWAAEIKHNHKKINLGCFKNIEDAIKARKEAELIYCKDFIPMEVSNG